MHPSRSRAPLLSTTTCSRQARHTLSTSTVLHATIFFMADSSVRRDDASEFVDAHEIRITSHGKMNAWVEFALKFFEENEDRPLTLHTLPAPPPVTPSENGDKSNTGSIGIGAPAPKADRMSPSTAVIPRLVSVVEIIKREYVKKLDPAMAEKGCLSGLHQYNELGALEDLSYEQKKEQTEEDRQAVIAHALQGKNHIQLKKTPYMKITLSRRKISAPTSMTYQQPAVRKLSKAARTRLKKRLEKEKCAVDSA